MNLEKSIKHDSVCHLFSEAGRTIPSQNSRRAHFCLPVILNLWPSMCPLHLRNQPLDTTNEISNKLLSFRDRWEDPEVVGQSFVVVVLGGHTCLLQSRLNHICIISQGIILAAGNVSWWVVLVVVRGQRSEDVAVLGIHSCFSIEDLHRLLIDDRHACLVLLVRLVEGLVLFRNVVEMQCAWHQCGDSFDVAAFGGILDNSIGHLQGQCTPCGASDRVEFVWVSTE